MFIGLDLGQEVYVFSIYNGNTLDKVYVREIRVEEESHNPIVRVGVSLKKEDKRAQDFYNIMDIYPTKKVAKELLKRHHEDLLQKTLEDID